MMNLNMWCLSYGRMVAVTNDREEFCMLLVWELYDDEETIVGRTIGGVRVIG